MQGLFVFVPFNSLINCIFLCAGFVQFVAFWGDLGHVSGRHLLNFMHTERSEPAIVTTRRMDEILWHFAC